MTTGVEDSSGFEFYYTTTKPMHEAGVLPVGHRVTPGMIIPPNTDSYVIEGLCPGRCTEEVSELVLYIDMRLYIFVQSFPPDGITVFANILHTHIYGNNDTV